MDLESLFVREFKSAIRVIGYKDIYKMPLPKDSKNWQVSGCHLYGIKGIKDEYFGKLNGTVTKSTYTSKVVPKRRIEKATRGFEKGEDGTFVYEDISIPSGCVAVKSDVMIGLPFKYSLKEPLEYVDFEETPEGKLYTYFIPKKYLYRVNQTALVVSVKNMKNFSGSGYTTWENGVVYIHVIPYNPKAQYVGSRVLKTGITLDYSREIQNILACWMMEGIVPDLRLTQLSTGENLAVKQTSVGYAEYIPIEQMSIVDKEVYGNNYENGEFNN